MIDTSKSHPENGNGTWFLVSNPSTYSNNIYINLKNEIIPCFLISCVTH